MKTLTTIANSVVGLEYNGVSYIVDYFNYPSESESGELEFICINHEDYYLADKVFKTERITESMLIEDNNSKVYGYKQLL